MLLGIAILSSGLKKAIGHLGDALPTAPAIALAGGVAVFLVGDLCLPKEDLCLPKEDLCLPKELADFSHVLRKRAERPPSSPRFRWQAPRRRPNFWDLTLSWS
jgi:hypothetical protein